MKKPKSLINVYIHSIALFALLFVVFFGSLEVVEKLHHLKADSVAIRNDYLASIKQTLRSEVESVLSYIEHKRFRTHDRLKRDIKSRTL